MAGLHTLKRKTLYPRRRLGRGQSSGGGKTAGRGTKGQNARAGRKKRPELRDIIKKLPKRRGFGKNRGRTVNQGRKIAIVIPLERLEGFSGEVTPQILAERGVLRARGGRLSLVKIVGSGSAPNISLKGVVVSAAARAAIEKAGGKVL